MKGRAITFTASLSAAACFALSLQVQAVNPPPDGCYPNFTTAEGCNALKALTTGVGNTGLGAFALYSNTDAGTNTAVGAAALALNTSDSNTAVGATALLLNTDGGANTAVGRNALTFNDSGFGNNAFGAFALLNNIRGFFNNAHGHNCLMNNADGDQNNAFGDEALFSNTSGSFNSAFGDDTLHDCTTGESNVAMGDEAGNSITDGSDNVVIGAGAGTNVMSGTGNVYVGANVVGPVDETRFVRIGDTSFADYDCFITGINGREVDAASAALVLVDSNQKVGTVPVNAAGNRVPFKPQAMMDELLNQQKRIAELEGTVDQQQKAMEVLTAQLKDQAAQIQKVNAQLQFTKHARHLTAKNW